MRATPKTLKRSGRGRFGTMQVCDGTEVGPRPPGRERVGKNQLCAKQVELVRALALTPKGVTMT